MTIDVLGMLHNLGPKTEWEICKKISWLTSSVEYSCTIRWGDDGFIQGTSFSPELAIEEAIAEWNGRNEIK